MAKFPRRPFEPAYSEVFKADKDQVAGREFDVLENCSSLSLITLLILNYERRWVA